jgi:hypothetical protein
MYLVLSAFTSSAVSLVAATKASAFIFSSYIYKYLFRGKVFVFYKSRIMNCPKLTFYDLKRQMKLKGLHFADVAEIQDAVTDQLKTVKKEEFSALFRNCTTS